MGIKKVSIRVCRLSVGSLSFFLLVGCAANSTPQVTTSSSAIEEPAAPAEGPADVARVPVRAYLMHGSQPDPNFGGYGYLIFTARPNNDTVERYKRICQAFHNNLVEASSDKPSMQHSEIVMYWPVRVMPAPSDTPDCETLVKNYDYPAASRIASAIGKQKSQGPILVAWDRSLQTAAGKGFLTLDLSRFADGDLDRGFRNWSGIVVKNPKVWHRGLAVIEIREGFRSLIQSYGAEIVAVIRPKRS